MRAGARSALVVVVISAAASVVTSAARVAAAPAPTASSPALDEARRHVERLEYDQALVALEVARRTAAADPAALAQTWLLEGYVEVGLDRRDRALAAFRRARRLSPGMRPAAGSSPKVTVIFDEAIALEAERTRRRGEARVELEAVAPPPVAGRALEIVARVRGAYDGLGVRLSLADDRGLAATLPMVARGGGRWAAIVPGELARAGALLSLRAELIDEGEAIVADPPPPRPAATLALPAMEAALAIASPIAGAEVLLDATLVGKTPLPALVPVVPGRHRLVLRAAGAQVVHEVEARRGEITRVALALGPRGAARLSIARTTLLVAGGVLLVAGIGLSIGAAAEANDVDGAATQHGLPGTAYSTVAGLERTGRALAITADVAFAIGGAAVLTGALLFLKRPPADKARRVALGPGGVTF